MSRRLKNIFFISLLLIYFHGLEEILTGFQQNDSFIVFGARYFSTTPQIFYWTSHIIWWLLVPVMYLLFKKSKWTLYLMALFGLIFLVELHHIAKGLLAWSYYPGMITALFYPLIGFVYWKQLISDWKNTRTV